MNKDIIANVWWAKNPLETYGLREGYHRAALELIKSLETSNSQLNLDTFVFPILFLHTHSLEIFLKEIIIKLNPKISSKELNTHKLNILWKTLLEPKLVNFCNKVGYFSEIGITNEFEELIKEFELYEYSSENNRYLTRYDKNIKKDILTHPQIIIENYAELKIKINKSYNLLEGLSLMIDEYSTHSY